MKSSKAPSAKRSKKSRRSRKKFPIPTSEGAKRYSRNRLLAYAPPPKLTIHEDVEKHRRLTGGPVPGRWKTRPHQKQVLDAVTEPGVEGTLYIAASQGGGKTELLLCVLHYHMHADPSDCLLVEPTIEMSDAFSKDRLSKMIAASPVLRNRVKDPRTRDSGNTIRHKIYPGGAVTMVGANSPSGLAMRPERVLLIDEFDRFADSAGDEGDPMLIAFARTFAYRVLGLARHFYVTSPKYVGGRSWKLWQKTDQQEYMVPCPDCGEKQFLKWAQVQWEKDEAGEHLPETAVYVCEHCGSCWDDAERWAAVKRAAELGDPYEATAPFKGWHGFRAPGMLVEGSTLKSFANQWLEAQGDPTQLQVFLNTVACEWYQEDGDGVDETGLMERREDWSVLIPKGAELPLGVAVLTIGVDVQKDRLEYEVIGWGRGEESWSIEYGKIYGNAKEDPSVFDDLDKILLRPWVHAKGFELYIRAACVDTGYATQAVYKWCKPRLRRPLSNGQSQFVFAIKGRTNEPGRPVWPETSSSRRTKLSGRVNLWIVGVHSGKDQVMARLGIAEPGPGYCHFDLNRGADYFKGLTAEHCIVRGSKRKWVEKVDGQPNEPLDCRNYGYTALVGIQAKPFLLNLEAQCLAIESASDQPIGKDAPVKRPGAKARSRRVRSTGYEA